MASGTARSRLKEELQHPIGSVHGIDDKCNKSKVPCVSALASAKS